MSSPLPDQPQPQTFRLPPMAYGVVLLLLFGAIPLAFTRDGTEGSAATVSLRTVVILVPLLAAGFIARTATIVDARGVRVRALFGQRVLPWPEVRGLAVQDRSIYAVTDAGSIRLPCVRVSDLAAVSRASGGHLPEIAEATPKFAPMPRRRRR